MRAYVPVKIADGLEGALVRLDDPRVFLMLTLNDTLGRKFDQYRMPLIWFDDEVGVDLGETKAFYDLMQNVDPQNNKLPLMFEDREIVGLIWHGQVNEGTGHIGRILRARNVVVRVYFADYDIEEYLVAPADLEALKRGIVSDILRV